MRRGFLYFDTAISHFINSLKSVSHDWKRRCFGQVIHGGSYLTIPSYVPLVGLLESKMLRKISRHASNWFGWLPTSIAYGHIFRGLDTPQGDDSIGRV
jgi:hypothetical protein